MLDRRSFLKTALASSAGLGLPCCANAQHFDPLEGNPRRIDVHHHIAPPAWVEEVSGRPLLNPANTRWTPGLSIEDMDRGGVATSVISITNPGLWFGDPSQTAKLARACNEYGAELVAKHPGRFGLFAAVPLPDIDASLKEIEYAYDVLGTDGIGLFTSYGNQWLGHPDFRPVMAELNRRKAVVAVHPTAADCCLNLEYAPHTNPGGIEYGTDTTRAIMGIVFSGDAMRFPDIRFIWSHAGGSLPFFAGRLRRYESRVPELMPEGGLPEILGDFFYDVAGAANRGALVSLLELVETSQIVFGTDFPPGGTSAEVAEALFKTGLFSPQDLRAIGRGNAVNLFSRFA